MLTALMLEAIGYHAADRHGGLTRLCVNHLARQRARQRCWVARLVDGQYQFIAPRVDWGEANGCGSRGVRFCYLLEPGLYVVSAPRSWGRTDRYRLRVHGDGTSTREPICRNATSASTF